MASSKAIGHQHASPSHRARSVPIGDYGFLSDGEVCALLAPGGSVDWMCVPRFDSASVFGRMLGPHAGSFRISPADVEVPGRRPLPPRHDDRRDQLGHRDRVDHRPRRAADGSLAARGDAVEDPPPDPERLRRRAHPAADRPLRLRRGADGDGLRAGLRLRPPHRRLGLHRARLPPGPRDRRRRRLRADPDHRPAVGLRGRPGQRPDAAQGGRHPVRRAVVGQQGAAADLRGRVPPAGLDRAPLAALAGPRAASPTIRGGPICSAAPSR